MSVRYMRLISNIFRVESDELVHVRYSCSWEERLVASAPCYAAKDTNDEQDPVHAHLLSGAFKRGQIRKATGI